jgi:DNA-binding transcriptional LysR family regulator
LGEADLAVGAYARVPACLRQHFLREDPWVLAVPAGTELDPLDRLTSVAGMRLIEDRSQPAPIDIEALTSLEPVRCDRAALAHPLVRAGVGYAILPRLAVGRPEGLVCRSLAGIVPPRRLEAIWPSARQVPALEDALAPLKVEPLAQAA